MAKFPKSHDENFRKGTKMARKIADRESLDYIIDVLDDMIDCYREKFNEKRGDGTYWNRKKYRMARRQVFTALSNVCRSYINLGLDEDDDSVDWDTILTLQSRRGPIWKNGVEQSEGVQKWPDTGNHHIKEEVRNVA